MFTGIIEVLGKILFICELHAQAKFRIQCNFIPMDLQRGASIAINGVCLTVEEFGNDWFEVYASSETMQLTNLQYLHTGDLVNLERALLIGARLGGHFVTGHVDTVATVKTISNAGESKIVKLEFAPQFGDYFVTKGSVALDGISLTVNRCGKDFIEVNIIPETQKVTTISRWNIGYQANMETDLIGKYLGAKQKNSEITLEFLTKNFR